MSKEFNLSKVIGKSILLASIQSAIGSVEMSSKFWNVWLGPNFKTGL